MKKKKKKFWISLLMMIEMEDGKPLEKKKMKKKYWIGLLKMVKKKKKMIMKNKKYVINNKGIINVFVKNRFS